MLPLFSPRVGTGVTKAQARRGGMPVTQTSKVSVALVGSPVNKAGGPAEFSTGCSYGGRASVEALGGLLSLGAQGQFWKDESRDTEWGWGRFLL